MPPSGTSGGMRLIGGAEFSAEDVAQMSPEDIQYYQEMGMMPPTSELAQNMDLQQPGILEQMSDELKEFFEKQAEEDQKENEQKPLKVTPEEEKLQKQKFNKSMHQPTVIEQYLNDRYKYPANRREIMPGEQDFLNVQKGKRGKYPRSGGERGTYQ
jgi:hypothetical protein